jgi:hypothetical protein
LVAGLLSVTRATPRESTATSMNSKLLTINSPMKQVRDGSEWLQQLCCLVSAPHRTMTKPSGQTC